MAISAIKSAGRFVMRQPRALGRHIEKKRLKCREKNMRVSFSSNKRLIDIIKEKRTRNESFLMKILDKEPTVDEKKYLSNKIDDISDSKTPLKCTLDKVEFPEAEKAEVITRKEAVRRLIKDIFDEEFTIEQINLLGKEGIKFLSEFIKAKNKDGVYEYIMMLINKGKLADFYRLCSNFPRKETPPVQDAMPLRPDEKINQFAWESLFGEVEDGFETGNDSENENEDERIIKELMDKLKSFFEELQDTCWKLYKIEFNRDNIKKSVHSPKTMYRDTSKRYGEYLNNSSLRVDKALKKIELYSVSVSPNKSKFSKIQQMTKPNYMVLTLLESRLKYEKRKLRNVKMSSPYFYPERPDTNSRNSKRKLVKTVGGMKIVTLGSVCR
ncbi:MAG: hypothetical protein HRT90_11620 [Candidatus Margulisbacteria bacterium]|nr:hypothetical protein [Candidatus Margulisiibacteriota bacterium]